VLNQKGGTAKTTTAVNVAACLTTRRQKVLLVDLDPQGSATNWMLSGNERPEASAAALFDGAAIDTQIVTTDIVDLVPSSPDLLAVERTNDHQIVKTALSLADAVRLGLHRLPAEPGCPRVQRDAGGDDGDRTGRGARPGVGWLGPARANC
jgi:cellulose biosynthesis protein BcsQ